MSPDVLPAGPMTLPAILVRRGHEQAEMDALVDGDVRISWAELEAASRRRAATLVARGVNRRTRVALLMPNGIEWSVNAFAIMRLGAVLVPLSTLLRAPELADQLRRAAVQRLIMVEEIRGRDLREEFAAVLGSGGPTEQLPALQSVWRPADLSDAPLSDERVVDALRSGELPSDAAMAAALEARVRPADDLAILFTSGSRDAPKGVIHTHGNALRAVASGLSARCVRPGERLYIPMPFFWMGGFGGGLLTVLVAGATLLTEAAPQPEATLAFLQRERATLFRGWPDQAAALAAHPLAGQTDLSSLQGGSLGALLPPELRGSPGSRANLFGMTESFGPYCGFRLDQDMPADKWGSCGKPFDGMEVRAVDPDSGLPVPAGEAGIIQLRGRHMLRGICGRSREEVFTPDTWFSTGDMGTLDADGFLWFRGRSDDMLKIRGATVYPSEVEAALAGLPHVTRAFVTDVPGASGAPEVAAAVVPDRTGALTVESVLAELKPRLSSFKLPSRLLILAAGGDVPRMATGKVDTQGLRSMFLAAEAVRD